LFSYCGLTINAVDEKTYILTGGVSKDISAALLSQDAGNSFVPTPNLPNYGYIYPIQVDDMFYTIATDSSQQQIIAVASAISGPWNLIKQNTCPIGDLRYFAGQWIIGGGLSTSTDGDKWSEWNVSSLFPQAGLFSIIQDSNTLYGLAYVGNPQVKFLYETVDGVSFKSYSLEAISDLYYMSAIAIGNSHIVTCGVYTLTVRHGWNFEFYYTFYSSNKDTDGSGSFSHNIIDGPTQTSADISVVFAPSQSVFVLKYGDQWFSSQDGTNWKDISASVLKGFGGSTIGWTLLSVGPQIFLFNTTDGEYYTSQDAFTWKQSSLSINLGLGGDNLEWMSTENTFVYTNQKGMWALSNDAVEWTSQPSVAAGLLHVSSDGNENWLAMLATQSLNFPNDAIMLKSDSLTS